MGGGGFVGLWVCVCGRGCGGAGQQVTHPLLLGGCSQAIVTRRDGGRARGLSLRCMQSGRGSPAVLLRLCCFRARAPPLSRSFCSALRFGVATTAAHARLAPQRALRVLAHAQNSGNKATTRGAGGEARGKARNRALKMANGRGHGGGAGGGTARQNQCRHLPRGTKASSTAPLAAGWARP